MFDQTLFNLENDFYKTKFTPDLYWIKNTGEGSHLLLDSETPNNTLSFDTTDGYVYHEDGNIVNNKNSLVSSSYIAALNYSLGFMSKVSYTGTGTLLTPHHSLKTSPEFVIFKNVSAPGDWIAWHYTFSFKGYLTINTDNSFVENRTIFSDKIQNKFNLYVNGDLSLRDNNYVAYLFGFSKYFCSGFYEGNEVVTVNTKNKPDMVIIKRVDQPGSWRLFSRKFNENSSLRLNSYGGLTENDDLLAINFMDTGFTINKNSAALNASGGKYIYLCFTQDC